MLTESLLHFFEKLGAEWVLWLLLSLGVVAATVMVERFLYFRRNKVNPRELTSELLGALKSGGSAKARETVAKVPGMTGGVLQAAMDAYDDGVEAVEEVILSSISHERVNYDRFLPILGTLGNSAPFIGLFGTVIGILTAFSALGSDLDGAVLKAQVMSHIGEALIATAVGLAVAIPSVVAFNIYKTRIKVMSANTEGVARMVLAHLKANGNGEGGHGGR